MTPLLASHTMPSLFDMLGETTPLLIICAGLFAIPLLVASSRGGRAVAHLRLPLHFLVMVAGATVGMAAALGVVALAVVLMPGCLSALLGIVAGGASGAALAYRTGRFIAAKLNWYTCRRCGLWFQARLRSEHCPACDAVRDRVAMADALAEFDKRFEQTLPPPGP